MKAVDCSKPSAALGPAVSFMSLTFTTERCRRRQSRPACHNRIAPWEGKVKRSVALVQEVMNSRATSAIPIVMISRARCRHLVLHIHSLPSPPHFQSSRLPTSSSPALSHT
jgi:hypothetical protein